MNGKITPLAPQKLIRALEKAGFAVIRQKGSHIFMEHPDGRTSVIPYHAGEELGIGLIRKIMKDACMTREEFFELLKR
jgi:predicted RNA binding protein YcfA (HicA-like mRNA interferase family)